MSDDRHDETYAAYLKEEERRQREREDAAPGEAAKNYVADSKAAAHRLGVLYQGEFETPSDGTARAVRLHARALAETGVPLLLRSFSGVVVNALGVAEPVYISGMPDETEKEVGHLLSTDIAESRPVIKHVVIRSAEHCRQLLMPRGAIALERGIEAQMKLRDAIYDNTIVYSVWERDRIDPGIASQLARVKQNWVPCSMNAALLLRSGVPADRIHIVPHPYTDDDMIHYCTKRPRGEHDGWKRFYSIGRWEPRKGFVSLIHAFLSAFKPGDKASLTIKYSGSGHWLDYLTPDQALEMLVRSPGASNNGWSLSSLRDHIQLLDGRIKRSMICKLHYENNIYVSASHGEAFGLPAFDAKLAGNAMVYVPYGGVADLAEDSDIQIPWSFGPADPSYRWEHGAQWAHYLIEDLSEGLKRARVPDEFRRPERFEQEFSLAAVGRKMRDLVDVAVGPETYRPKPTSKPPDV